MHRSYDITLTACGHAPTQLFLCVVLAVQHVRQMKGVQTTHSRSNKPHEHERCPAPTQKKTQSSWGQLTQNGGCCPTSSREKTRDKNPCGENTLEKTQTKIEQPYTITQELSNSTLPGVTPSTAGELSA